MSPKGRVHDRALLDALEALSPEAFEGEVWRITREGRDPLISSTADGRWSASGELAVLYTSLEREGALAEIGYRLSLEPVWPSRVEHQLHLIAARTERSLRFADVKALSDLGVDPSKYGSFDYVVTQAIAAASYFLEYDSLIVPSARAPNSNLVIFLDRLPPGSLEVRNTSDVDWGSWKATRSR